MYLQHFVHFIRTKTHERNWRYVSCLLVVIGYPVHFKNHVRFFLNLHFSSLKESQLNLKWIQLELMLILCVRPNPWNFPVILSGFFWKSRSSTQSFVLPAVGFYCRYPEAKCIVQARLIFPTVNDPIFILSLAFSVGDGQMQPCPEGRPVQVDKVGSSEGSLSHRAHVGSTVPPRHSHSKCLKRCQHKKTNFLFSDFLAKISPEAPSSEGEHSGKDRNRITGKTDVLA